MEFSLEQAVEVLRRTPNVVDAMLRGLSDPWVMNNYGLDTFSPFDVVGHLIHGEKTDWIPRLRIILEHRDSVPFEPFDRYAMYEASKGKRIADLLGEFASLRNDNIESLMAMKLTSNHLEYCGKHPALGIVTVRNLLATWVAHDLNHTHQIAKSMAWQYRDAVGPWREYLTVIPGE